MYSIFNFLSFHKFINMRGATTRDFDGTNSHARRNSTLLTLVFIVVHLPLPFGYFSVRLAQVCCTKIRLNVHHGMDHLQTTQGWLGMAQLVGCGFESRSDHLAILTVSAKHSFK